MMPKDKIFRECISDNDNELVIYVADNFPQFPQRDSSVTSKCERTLPSSALGDLRQRKSTDLERVVVVVALQPQLGLVRVDGEHVGARATLNDHRGAVAGAEPAARRRRQGREDVFGEQQAV